MSTPAAPEAIAKPSVPQPSEETGSSTLVRAHSEAEPSADTLPLDSVSTTPSPSTAARRRSWFYADTEHDCEHAKEVEQEIHGRKERRAEPDDRLTPLSDTSTMQPVNTSDNDQDAHEYLIPRSRSSRAHSVSSSVGGDESSNFSDTSATSKSPRHSLGPSTTSSFLSTLKSKAGDKQALSNTAKEAMRKWANWGLKKENGGNPSPDDLADVGPSYHRPRTESTHGHQSYADMRTAVIERRGREQGEKVDGNTSPIPIPQSNSGEKGRSPSASGGRMTLHSSGSTSPRSLGDDPFKDQVAESDLAPSLIHTQPSQARTMTIPGIHASHKGEVMSMGNVAPTLPAPEIKPKGPTIQSMYRLWKSPVLTGQPSQEAQPSSCRHGDTNDGNLDVAPLSLTPDVVSPRAVPPPLPPRTISTVAVRHATECTDESVVVSSVSAASQALKSIASRDETRRVSVEVNVPVDGEPALPSEVSSSKPPLPPRRVPV